MASHRPWMRKIVVLLLGLFFLMPGLFARDWYVRPAGGNYGSENGTSYANAWDGLKNVKWGTGGVQPGDTLYVCGLHLADSFQAQSISVISGTGENARVTIRGDYPGDPGVVWGAYKMAWEPWVYEGNNVWSITLYADMNNDWYFEDITSGSWVVLDKEITLQACQGNPGSFYAASWGYGSKFYVHCSDSGNPTGRIYAPRWGYGFDIHGKQYITFLNLKFYNVYRFLWPGEGYATHIRWEGCTIMYGEHSLITLPDNADYLEVINCDLSWAANGIYIVSDSNKAASYYKFSGNTIHDMGVRPSTRNKDAHGIGVQGGHDGLIENNYIYNCGTGITFFTWTNQECKNTIVRRNFIRDPHTLGGAFGYGIETSSSNDSLSDKSGNIFYQNIVVNAVLGFKLQWEDEQKLYNNVAINCGTSFYSARSYNNYGPKVTARNNISVNPTDRHVIFATSGDDSLCNYDYNLYYPDGAGKFYYNGAYNFSGWKAISRAGYTFDPNSKVADPLFVNPGKENFQLQSSSPAIDAGVSVGLSHDRQGTPIPQGFAPDIGAYEYIFASNPLVVSASASPTSGNAPLTVNFTGSASGGSPPYSFNWTFGDGQSSSSQNPSHTYSSAGNYTATLTVTDSQGTNGNKSVSITVTSPPPPPPPPPQLVASASASPASGMAPLTVNFSGSASGGTPPYSYSWNFGDGGTSTAQNPTHTYSTAGNYLAIFTVTDSQSAQKSASVSITVSSVPNTLTALASASPTSGQPPLTVNFTGGASGGVAPYSYSWNFGDGASSTAQNPSHTYSATGSYTATLTVIDKNSASANATVVITVSKVSIYNLSIASETGAPAPGQGGTTHPSPGNHAFPVGSTAEVRSIANPNYRFSKWAGDILETFLFSQQATIIMDRNRSVTATFCSMCGDVNGDLKITPADAQAAFNIFLGRLPNPTWCEKENADVNSSGTKLEPKVTPADAQAIFKKFLKKGELPSDCSGNVRSAMEGIVLPLTREIQSVSLTIGTVAAKSGDDIYIPIYIESTAEIGAFGLDLEFPSDKLTFVGLERTVLTESYDRVDANVISPEYSEEKADKKENYSTLRIGGFKTDLTFGATSGVLVTLIFRVEHDLVEEAPLSVTASYDDIKNASVKNWLIKPKNSQNETERANKRFVEKRLDF